MLPLLPLLTLTPYFIFSAVKLSLISGKSDAGSENCSLTKNCVLEYIFAFCFLPRPSLREQKHCCHKWEHIKTVDKTRAKCFDGRLEIRVKK
jgi:hypothetical protein